MPCYIGRVILEISGAGCFRANLMLSTISVIFVLYLPSQSWSLFGLKEGKGRQIRIKKQKFHILCQFFVRNWIRYYLLRQNLSKIAKKLIF
jgi:hypothetical protein